MRCAVRTYGKRILVLLICLFFIFSGLTRIKASENPENRTVKAGIFYFEGYHMKDENGNLDGYGIEFLNLISKYSHLNFEYVGYEKSWGEMLTMLEDGEIDVVTSARKNPEREKLFAFSLPIGRNSTILSIQVNDNRFYSGDYQSYDGMRIGLVAGSSQNQTLQEFAEEKNFSYKAVEYEDMEHLTEALKNGQIDAILSSNLRKTQNEKTLDTLETENFYAIVRKEDTELLDEINYAIGQMDINEGDWANTLYYKYYGAVPSSELTFTEREKAYIQDVLSGKKTITATALGDRAPYSYVEDGELTGIMPDFFRDVMEIAGLPYEMIVPEDRADYYELASENGVDVVIDKRTTEGVIENDSSQGFLTDPYLTAGMAKVTREDFSGEIKTVAIADMQGDDLLEKGLLDDVEVLHCSTREESLKAVRDGKADAAYVYTYTAQMFVNNDFTKIMHYSMVNGTRFAFQMYVRDSSDHELVTILNKCIRQIPGDVFDELITEYTASTPKNLTFFQYMQAHPGKLIAVILIAAAILGIIIAVCARARWDRKILEASRRSNKELQKQLAIVDALSREYQNVYSINTDDETGKVIKMEGYVTSGLRRAPGEVFSYDSFVEQYIQERVYLEDQQYMREAMSLARTADKLSSHTEYSESYRALMDQEVHNFQFTFVKVEGKNMLEDHTILLGMRNIDEMVRREQNQKEVLAEALAEAQHANVAKTTFLNNMSHDIRTPMNAIIGFTSLAASHIESRDLVLNYLDKILTSSTHLLSLINDVLDMSRIESGKVTIEEKEASLPEILHDLKTIVQADVKAKQLEFYIDTLDVTNETIICDKLRLNQVLLNILSNAMKYTKPGGTVSVRIIQSPDAQKGYASYQFKVKDTGIGMSRKFLKHVFEPFEREETATVSGIQGTGLGLAITKNIIDMMNGTVTVESEQGKGSEFTVSFRFRIVDSQAKEEQVKELTGLRALVVDDDINTCTSVSKMLSSIGMVPDWTTLGKEAVVRTEFAMEQKKPYSAYIIDWLMPDMNGIEVVRRIRKVIGEMATIIILTAYDWADIEQEAKEAGVTAFCSKPIFLSELRGILTAPYMKVEKQETEEIIDESFIGKKILLTEDNELNQEIAQEILEEAGFVIDIVSDGTEAVDTIKKMPGDTYDLILMDIQMPIMNGYEAAKAIRALDDPVRSSIPIVAMTANAFEEDRQKALNAGMNGHVPKPIDVPRLMDTLREILKV